MSEDNRISAELADAAKTQILTKLGEIKALLPFLLELTPEDRRRTPTIGTERTGMVAAFTQQMAAHPEFIPGFVKMDEVTKDQNLRAALLEVFGPLSELLKSQSDTLQAIGADLYTAFMAYYASVQSAADRNVPTAETVLNALQEFIPRGRRAKTANSGSSTTPKA